MTELSEYADKYEIATLTREDGVLEIALQSSDGGPLVWGSVSHSQLGHLWNDVGADRDNEVIILTGTSDGFIPAVDMSGVGIPGPEDWDRISSNGKRMRRNLLAIEVPMIAAVNGPARVHSEQALMCDIVIASENADFQDSGHFINGLVPGDFVQTVYTHLLGLNRGRYFLYMGQIIDAAQALELGLVSEVTSSEELLPRARTIAAHMMKQPRMVRRHTRAVTIDPLRRLYADHHDLGTTLEALGIWGAFSASNAGS
ncbi:enoyl-CoA hydratase/isomerase family protein [Rhodococcus opacus]|uniref:enoyl-CoA hydratase/isomerase family protein n=1 Tax=Rhodococcus opacus TaxID=37919 RepID=UPI0024735BD5|nr:enoyl-CoA hydratase/isomerase family protein [Rhodococcus opacus]MDH6291985.1 enoyl-CoA hydratase/carnithine racemase [Rhodococcus opacus]